MISGGEAAYINYRRIFAEAGRVKPDWRDLNHTKRLAFEAAAQAAVVNLMPKRGGHTDYGDNDQGEIED